MPKRKEPELDPAEQYERFKKAAKEAGVTDKEKEFERGFRVASKPPPKRPNKSGRSP